MSTGLFGSTILEVAIGLSFVYLLLSLVCTTVNEWIAGVFKTRGKLLADALHQLLDGQPHGGLEDGFLHAFYKHPLMQGMMQDSRHPSYLPARTFTAIVMDLAKHPPDSAAPAAGAPPAGPPAPAPSATPHTLIANLPEGDVKKALRALLPPEGGDFSDLHENVEGWFNDAMDRISGAFKRRTQIWTLIGALAMTVAINADTLKIARHLWTDPILRQSVADAAKARSAEPGPSMRVDYKDADDPLKPTVTRQENRPIHEDEQKLLEQLIGWGDEETKRTAWTDWGLPALGWLLTAIAISLGAPFWFDLLNKFINIRSAGKSPDEAAKTPKKKKLPPADKAA